MSTNSRESAPSDPRGTSTTGEPPLDSSDLAKVMGPGLLLLFIVGDILGTGVYALTGTIAGEIGGAAWAPILLAFFVASVTAFSYLEMVTKYPGASGAALYTHKAFGIGLLTFMVTFAVLASGLTSASTAARTVASNLVAGFGWENPPMIAVTLMAVGFMVLLMIINLRSVKESLMLNVVLTCIELSGLAIVILIGLWAVTQGNADFSRTMIFETQGDKSLFLTLTAVTSLAFFSFVGFEDSVNMVEETKDPQKNFPRIMLIGLCITGAVYVLVSILAVAIVPIVPTVSLETMFFRFGAVCEREALPLAEGAVSMRTAPVTGESFELSRNWRMRSSSEALLWRSCGSLDARTGCEKDEADGKAPSRGLVKRFPIVSISSSSWSW